MQLSDSVTSIKGVGPKKASYFERLGIVNIGSLLYHFPRTYREYPEAGGIPEDISAPVSITGRLTKKPVTKRGRRVSVTTAYILVGEIRVTLVWFNIPHLSSNLNPEGEYVFYGRLTPEGEGYKMEQPAIFTRAKYEAVKESLQPIYPLTKDLKNSAVSSAVEECFKVLNETDIRDFLDEEYLFENELIPLYEALYSMHFPKTREHYKKARRRLVYNEFFNFFLRVSAGRDEEDNIKNPFSLSRESIYKQAIKELPFKLTDGQTGVLEEIIADFRGEYVTQRLIQGDVGSGKTILSLLSMLVFLENGYKAAIMAPTEVLAGQHFATFLKFIDMLKLPYEAVLLTGKMSAAEKREARARLKEPGPLFVIGTHALIQEGVVIADLGMVVVDEQHRFGVKQRKLLSDKGQTPFSLVMSATPIPRSLAMILYGGMNISVIKELPKNRLPIKNCIIRDDRRKTAYQFIISEIRKGHQAYIICPLVDKSEKSEAENVVEYADRLRASFPKDLGIGMLHGRMSSDEKASVMEDFYDKKTDILVSTTVIEVGIDVPNATVIMIENAGRFGLAQLHQLRGRVGRGDAQSFCIFMDDKKEGEDERLKVINSSNDGFYVANEDMRLRGPGELYGLRQSGGFGFMLADIYTDKDELTLASEKVKSIREGGSTLPETADLYQVLPSWNSWYNI